MWKRAIVTAALLTVSGCAGLPVPKDLQTVTLADVDAAIALAKQSGDQDGLACWEAIKAVVPADQTGPIEIKGALSAVQAARNVRRGVDAGVDPTVHRNCAVVVLDAQQTLLKLGVRINAIK